MIEALVTGGGSTTEGGSVSAGLRRELIRRDLSRKATVGKMLPIVARLLPAVKIVSM